MCVLLNMCESLVDVFASIEWNTLNECEEAKSQWILFIMTKFYFHVNRDKGEMRQRWIKFKLLISI